MNTYKTAATVDPDGSLELPHVPFPAGRRVEVEIQPLPKAVPNGAISLRGAILQYDDPTSPVAEDEWEAAK